MLELLPSGPGQVAAFEAKVAPTAGLLCNFRPEGAVDDLNPAIALPNGLDFIARVSEQSGAAGADQQDGVAAGEAAQVADVGR